MLLLIGLGLDTKDISVNALEALKKADTVLLEQYTAFIPDAYITYLKAESGKDIRIIGRSDAEENARPTLEAARVTDLAVLVPGDPLIATTHHSTLLNTARKMGIPFRIYHAPSVLSAAIGESGLDVYKFGMIVTIAFWSKNYRPTSFLDYINKNLKNSEHSLVLLDLGADNGKRPMSLEEAAELLRAAESEKGYGIVDDGLRLLVMGDIGRESQEIAYISLGEVSRVSSRFGGKILTLIIPSVLTFAEEESLKKYAAGH